MVAVVEIVGIADRVFVGDAAVQRADRDKALHLWHAQLDRIIASPEFSQAGSLARLLRYVITAALKGDTASVKESVRFQGRFTNDFLDADNLLFSIEGAVTARRIVQD